MSTRSARSSASASPASRRSGARSPSQAQMVIAHKQGTDALEEAKKQKNIADRRQVELEFARAVSWCEEGRVAQGMELFLSVVQLAEAIGAKDIARVARINLAAW